MLTYIYIYIFNYKASNECEIKLDFCVEMYIRQKMKEMRI